MQNRRGIILIVLALVMGTGAAWFSQRLVSSPDGTEEVVRTSPVVIVRADLPVATSLTKEHLQLADWPADLVPRGAIGSVDGAVGRVLRRPLATGEPVLEMALLETGAAGGLRAVIEHGHRAVTVKVDSVIGVAGFVTPGSRVDVMATMRRVDHSRALPYSKAILQNIRVLAVDQKLEEATSGEPQVVSVVTLEVDPVQAEHLTYAAHEGRLQLAMRTPGDDQVVETDSVGVGDLLGERQVAKAAPRRRARTTVQVLNGTELENTRF